MADTCQTVPPATFSLDAWRADREVVLREPLDKIEAHDAGSIPNAVGRVRVADRELLRLAGKVIGEAENRSKQKAVREQRPSVQPGRHQAGHGAIALFR